MGEGRAGIERYSEGKAGAIGGRKPHRMRPPHIPSPPTHPPTSSPSPLPGPIEPSWLNSSGIHKGRSPAPTSPELSVMDGMRGLGSFVDHYPCHILLQHRRPPRLWVG